MTQDTKVKIWAIVISSAISLTGVIYSMTRVNAQKLEQKVDKEQYESDCKKMDERVKNVENINQMLYEIKTEQSATRTDIEWIKKTLDKKPK